MATPLADKLAHHLDLSPEIVRRTLPALLQGLREEIERTGQADLPGLGTFRFTEDETLAFEPGETLAQAVNRHYAGLEPLVLPEAPQTTAPEEEAEPTDEDWELGDTPDEDHPLGPLPTPEYEEADYSVVEEEKAAEEGAVEEEPSPSDARPAPERQVVLPAGLTLATLSTEWTQNQHLAPENLSGARLVSPAPSADTADTTPAPEPPAEAEPAPEAEPVPEAEPEREPVAEAEPATAQTENRPPVPSSDGKESRPAALPWVLGLLALLVVGFGAWFALGESGLVAGPFASSSAPAGEEAAEETASDLTADTAEAVASDAPPDTAAAASGEAPDEAPEEEEEEELAPAGIDRAAGGWTLVVSSETERAEAEDIMRDYRESFADSEFAVDIFTATVEGGEHHRVAVGRFESSSDALEAKETFSDRFPESAWLLRIEPDM